jgi:hypothetical protein
VRLPTQNATYCVGYRNWLEGGKGRESVESCSIVHEHVDDQRTPRAAGLFRLVNTPLPLPLPWLLKESPCPFRYLISFVPPSPPVPLQA